MKAMLVNAELPEATAVRERHERDEKIAALARAALVFDGSVASWSYPGLSALEKAIKEERRMIR